MQLRTIATAVAAAALVASPFVARTATPVGAAGTSAFAPVAFAVDAAHSNVVFKVRHLGLSTVTGRFGSFEGSFQLDPATGAASSATLSINVASVNTDNERRDGHLKSADFFAADSFPKITFTSTSIQKVGAKYKVNGNLTMRGVTKPITLDAELAGTRNTPQGWLAAVNMTGTIKRKEFGLMWDRMTEGVAVVSDDVQLVIDVEAKTAAPAK